MQPSHALSFCRILDTDIVVGFLRRKDHPGELLLNWAGKGLLAISSITHLEIHAGHYPFKGLKVVRGL